MKNGLITRAEHPATSPDPGWDGRALRAFPLLMWVAVALLALGPLSALAGLVSVSAVLSPDWLGPLALQIGIAAIGGVLALALAMPLGWFLARGAAGQPADGSPAALVRWVRLLVVLGLVCPPAVIGLGFANVALLPSVVGLPLVPAWVMAVVIATAVALPVAALVIDSAWRGVDGDDEQVGAAMGWPVADLFGLLVKPRLTPSLRPALGLGIARVLAEWSAYYFLVANDQGDPLATFALAAVSPHVTNSGVGRASAAILLVLTIALVVACRGAVFGLIPHVSHRIATHRYNPDLLHLEPEEDAEADAASAEDGEADTSADVDALFAEINGPGLAYAEQLTEEETAYLTATEAREAAPTDPIWEGAPGMPKAWDIPGSYWPQADAAEPIDLPEMGERPEDDDTVLGERSTTPFLRIRTRNEDEA